MKCLKDSLCAVTRAQAHKLADADELASTFEHGILMADEGEEDGKHDSNLNDVKSPVTRDNIVSAQGADVTLYKCFSSVVPLELARERKQLTVWITGC